MKYYGIGELVHRIQKLFLETITSHQSSHLHSLFPSPPSPGTIGKKQLGAPRGYIAKSRLLMWNENNRTGYGPVLNCFLHTPVLWSTEKTGLVWVGVLREMSFFFSQGRKRANALISVAALDGAD